MSSLLSDPEKLALAASIKDVHDTFAREIKIYSEPIHKVFASDSNPLYSYPRAASKETLSDSITLVLARILFGRPANSVLTGGADGEDSVLTLPNGWVRIKVEIQYADLLNKSKRVEIDGSFFVFDSYPRPHGLFDSNYATFILRPLNSK